MPDSPERAELELALQTTLGPALAATKGYASPEAEHTYARARELCERARETPELFPVLDGLYSIFIVRAKHREALKLAKQLLAVAQREQDPLLLAQAHRAVSVPLFFLGEFVCAREHLEQSHALFDPERHRGTRIGRDTGVFTQSWLSHVLWHLGYPNQAVKRSQESLALAQELSHPFNLAIALDYAAMLHQFRREADKVRVRAEAAIVVCQEQRCLKKSGGTSTIPESKMSLFF